MRDQPGPTDLLEAEDDEADKEVGVDDGEERPRRVTPSLAKAISYRRDRRLIAEDPRWSRKTWPRIKVLRNQANRRKAGRALRPALGKVTPEIDDFAPALPWYSYQKFSGYHANIPLGQWVQGKLEKRHALVGKNIAHHVLDRRYRLRLVPFLQSLIAGHHGHSVELAGQFKRILDHMPFWSPRLGTDRRPYNDQFTSRLWHRALTELFEEQPEWETRLRAWIAEVAPSEPPADEPIWHRIRRLRKRPTR